MPVSEFPAGLALVKLIKSTIKANSDKLGIVSPYIKKVVHVVANEYQLHEDHGVAAHKDASTTYSELDPITSFSFGAGALFTLQDAKSGYSGSGNMSLLWLEPGDVLYMAGQCHLDFGYVELKFFF